MSHLLRGVDTSSLGWLSIGVTEEGTLSGRLFTQVHAEPLALLAMMTLHPDLAFPGWYRQISPWASLACAQHGFKYSLLRTRRSPMTDPGRVRCLLGQFHGPRPVV